MKPNLSAGAVCTILVVSLLTAVGTIGVLLVTFPPSPLVTLLGFSLIVAVATISVLIL